MHLDKCDSRMMCYLMSCGNVLMFVGLMMTIIMRCSIMWVLRFIFHEMEESGVRPDGITFISLLYACSHSGLVEEGCG